MCSTLSGWPASTSRTRATQSSDAERSDGARTQRRVASMTSGKSAHVPPMAQRRKKVSALTYMKPAAAKRATLSRQPSSRAKRNAPSPARKKVSAAENVSPFATGSSSASSVNGE